ncbi:MAG TPA: molybdenum cofactor guanylyltransferase [Gemmatimonadales bacterium]
MRTAILAGGGATRFAGRPKGLEVIGGRRILDRLVETCIAAFGEPPLLVANAPEAPAWAPTLRVVPDRRPGVGALGGILTAVVAAPAPVVVVAWDMPFVTAALLRALADRLDGVDAVLPASGSRRGVEPLCAAYGPACGPAIERALAKGDQRAIGFHAHVRVAVLGEVEVGAWGDPARLFFNVNSPQDLLEAERLAAMT